MYVTGATSYKLGDLAPHTASLSTQNTWKFMRHLSNYVPILDESRSRGLTSLFIHLNIQHRKH